MPETVRLGVCGNMKAAQRLLQLHNVVVVADGGSQSARGEQKSTTVLCANADVREQFMAVMPLAMPLPNPTGESYSTLLIAQSGQWVIDQLEANKPDGWDYLNYLAS